MKILYVTSEAAPFCKTGGLADVSGSLPPALKEQGHEVAVILPLYSAIGEKWREQMTFRKFIYVDLAWRHEYCGLYSLEHRGVTWYFVDNEHYFHRAALYGEGDDGERFAFFCRAVMDLLPSLDWMPEVLHCNDWQTALIPIYQRDMAHYQEEMRGLRTVFTIHNIEYQGWLDSYATEDLLGLNRGWFEDGTLAFNGAVNLMKGAMLTCDALTTVSPTYAQQLKNSYYASGMEQIVTLCDNKLSGVLNGLDMESFNPVTDGALCVNYGPEDMSGKAACKAALQERVGLAQESWRPVLSIVSRLVGHKGMDLICQVADSILETGCQLVVLGQGDYQYEEFFRQLAARWPGRVSAQITYSDALARQIYAGSDLFLMPSKSEPCGLSQMIAMRYGTVPIVRQTGGLNDTVRSCQVGQENGNGFVFANYNAFDMLFVIRQAVEMFFQRPEAFRTLRMRGMTGDYSWDVSARAYGDIYKRILGE
ncbi:MAG: glycogen synthase GlgA [Ruminococcaceae bacterium]|nr:glycogen synthase GlgA [Oscillospiraceae bacterium]